MTKAFVVLPTQRRLYPWSGSTSATRTTNHNIAKRLETWTGVARHDREVPMDANDVVGIAAFVLIPLLAFLSGATAGLGWGREDRRLLAAGLLGVALVTTATVVGSLVIEATSDDKTTLSASEQVASFLINAGIVLAIGVIGIAGGFALSRFQRTRQVEGRYLFLIVAVPILILLLICGSCLAFGYFFFGDVGLEPAPTSTPQP